MHETGRVTTNYTNLHESPGKPAPRAAWLGKGEGVACRANSPASALASALPGCAGQAFHPGEGANASIGCRGLSGLTEKSRCRGKANFVESFPVDYFDGVLGKDGGQKWRSMWFSVSIGGRNAVTGEAGMAKAGAAACELARNGTHTPLASTRQRGRHSGGFVQIRGIRGLLSSPWSRFSGPEDER